jgi:DNA-binding CsgD family transcriptional regulator
MVRLRPSDGHLPSLTADERRALGLSATGLTSAEVAVAMDIGPDEARGLLASAVRKLGARSKLEAVLIALRLALIEIPDE